MAEEAVKELSVVSNDDGGNANSGAASTTLITSTIQK